MRREPCANHLEIESVSVCHSCGKPFCSDCLVEGQDYYYCKSDECQRIMEPLKNDIETDDLNRVPLLNLVTVAAFSYPYEAELACGRLEAEGIEAVIADENMVSMNWLYSNAIGGVRLQVAESDAPRAREILETTSAEDHPPASEENVRCPACGSKETTYIDLSNKRLTYLSWLLLGIPLLRLRKRMKCNSCGHIWKPS
jgi:DNA-directed RNA polymerase subunit M/transcription elongation factor TFIIS